MEHAPATLARVRPARHSGPVDLEVPVSVLVRPKELVTASTVARHVQAWRIALIAPTVVLERSVRMRRVVDRMSVWARRFVVGIMRV